MLTVGCLTTRVHWCILCFWTFRNDKRFFLKTQNKREIKFLLSNLKIYVEHLRKFPHSLLVKFLGTTHNLTFSLTFNPTSWLVVLMILVFLPGVHRIRIPPGRKVKIRFDPVFWFWMSGSGSEESLNISPWRKVIFFFIPKCSIIKIN